MKPDIDKHWWEENCGLRPKLDTVSRCLMCKPLLNKHFFKNRKEFRNGGLIISGLMKTTFFAQNEHWWH